MSDKKYSWEGPWDGPGVGYYVVCDHGGREMEPGEVVGLLDRLADLEEQVARRPLSEVEYHRLTHGDWQAYDKEKAIMNDGAVGG